MPDPEDQPLAARAFDRPIDTEWRRTSYSGLIRVEEQAIATSEPEVPGKDDEPGADDAEELPTTDGGVDEPPSVADLVETPSPMADLPAGAGFGSLVHAILEHADPEAPGPPRRAPGASRRAAAVVAVRGERPTSSPMRLLPMNATSLGPLADGLTLAEIPLRDRLRELDFEIPLAGGDLTRGRGRRRRTTARPRAGAARTTSPPGDPMVAYADRLVLLRSPTRPCAAISPAASTSCFGCRRGGSSSSTTRPTGSARSAVR